MLSLFHAAHRLLRRPLVPRSFSTTGFEVIDKAQLVEEETGEWYKEEEFYPVKIGEVFNSKYQVVGKLGYGGYSTAWLCRDLVDHQHVTLKIGTHKSLERELNTLRHLRSIKTNHAGALLVRRVLDEFEVTNNDKKYQCILHEPMSITLESFRLMLPTKTFPASYVKSVLKHLFLALDFLHSEAGIIHTDIQEGNILRGMNEETAEQDLEKFETEELEHPCPRKVDGNRIIYTSRQLVPRIYPYGRPVLCDFGQAGFKTEPPRDIQPYEYRAPEVILSMPLWDEKVDIWNVGVMVGDPISSLTDRKLIDHLAHMIALLGHPPKDLLERCKTDWVLQYFDENSERHVFYLPFE